MSFTGNFYGFSSRAVKAGSLCLAILAVISLSSSAAIAHGAAGGPTFTYFTNDFPDNTTFTTTTPTNIPRTTNFGCTTTGGVLLRCTNLSADCAEWWSGCKKRVVIYPQRFPKHCENPVYKVVRIPVENSDEFIENRTYSTNEARSHSSATNVTYTELLQGAKGGKMPGDEKASTSNGGGGGGSNSADGDSEDNGASLGFAKGTGSPEASRSAPMGKEMNGGPMAAAAKPSARAGDMAGDSDGKVLGSGVAGGESGKSGKGEQSTYLAFAAGKFAGKGKTPEFAVSALPENTAVTKKSDSYTDPWMDYVSVASREELVTRLTKNAKLREELKRKLDNLTDGSGASDGVLAEKKEYYREALAEAQARLRRGTLDELAPLETHEAFSMNGDETDREIKRLLASMDEKAADLSDQDEGLNYPLFPRVHRALWRQLANGNINLKVKGR